MIEKAIRKSVSGFAKLKAECVEKDGFDKEFILNHLIEEMAELTQAIMKIKRYGMSDKVRVDNLYEELADVYIGIHEVGSLLNKERLESNIEEKLSKKEKYLKGWRKGEGKTKPHSQATAS